MTSKHFLPMINRIIRSVLIIQLILLSYAIQAQCPIDSITQNESFDLNGGVLSGCDCAPSHPRLWNEVIEVSMKLALLDELLPATELSLAQPAARIMHATIERERAEIASRTAASDVGLVSMCCSILCRGELHWR